MTPGEFATIEALAKLAREDTFRPGWPFGGTGEWTENLVGLLGGPVGDFVGAVSPDVVDGLIAAVRERDNTIARVREVSLLGLDEIAQKSIDATVARMQDQLGCTPDDLGPDVMAKIVDSHIEQAELFAGPVLDALRAALDPQETE